MIQYDNTQPWFFLKLRGSTIPMACSFAIPSGILSVLFRYCMESFPDEALIIGLGSFLEKTQVWSALTLSLGMLLSFRTSQAHMRFWEGTTLVHQLRAEWFDAASCLFAFTKQSRSPEVLTFQHTLIRLLSLMHGSALQQIGGSVDEFDVLDTEGLDDATIDHLNECELRHINRVEVLLHWIQRLVTENIGTSVLSIPPPIITRTYQTLSRGMVKLHDARKLSDIPFPFPYAQLMIILLVVHAVLTPLTVAHFVSKYVWCFLVTSIPVLGMWSLMLIAMQLEQPFGEDANDLPLSVLQREFNVSLLTLLTGSCRRVPTLKEGCVTDRLDALENSTQKTNYATERVRIKRQREQTNRRRSSGPFVGGFEDPGSFLRKVSKDDCPLSCRVNSLCIKDEERSRQISSNSTVSKSSVDEHRVSYRSVFSGMFEARGKRIGRFPPSVILDDDAGLSPSNTAKLNNEEHPCEVLGADIPPMWSAVPEPFLPISQPSDSQLSSSLIMVVEQETQNHKLAPAPSSAASDTNSNGMRSSRCKSARCRKPGEEAEQTPEASPRVSPEVLLRVSTRSSLAGTGSLEFSDCYLPRPGDSRRGLDVDACVMNGCGHGQEESFDLDVESDDLSFSSVVPNLTSSVDEPCAEPAVAPCHISGRRKHGSLNGVGGVGGGESSSTGAPCSEPPSSVSKEAAENFES